MATYGDVCSMQCVGVGMSVSDLMMEGRDFQLWTDRIPLVTTLTCVSESWSARQQQHLAAIVKFTLDLRYMPGPANVVAYALS
jgi:hypothetical protein